MLVKNHYLLLISMLISNLLINNLAANSDIERKALINNLSCTKDSCGTPTRRYLVFVSFSMPEIALKSLYLEANNSGGALLLRGLKNGSFKETAAYIKFLGIGVQIDPVAFKKYQIDRVPTIVLVNGSKFYAISGNVSFNYAKQKLLEAVGWGG